MENQSLLNNDFSIDIDITSLSSAILMFQLT